MPSSCRELTRFEFGELFVWVEKVLVGDYGVYLPAYWFKYTGVANECLTLCLEYLALTTNNQTLANWLTHVDSFVRRLGGSWPKDTSDYDIPQTGSFHAWRIMGVSQQRRINRDEFVDWLDSRPRPIRLNLPNLNHLLAQLAAE
ncbi:hypothetical protein [Ferrimicrobium sp.]|uniref:hypothetical protein n=1 Tax=Ferrimicrobium sp. TaxID=2926050 RepID=UPI00263718F7|nr:hypothetical protein [Ferrimicrobium sp.]